MTARITLATLALLLGACGTQAIEETTTTTEATTTTVEATTTTSETSWMDQDQSLPASGWTTTTTEAPAPTTTVSHPDDASAKSKACADAAIEMTALVDEAIISAEAGDLDAVEAATTAWGEAGGEMGTVCSPEDLDWRMTLMVEHLYNAYNESNVFGQEFISGVAGVFCDSDVWTIADEAQDQCVTLTVTHEETVEADPEEFDSGYDLPFDPGPAEMMYLDTLRDWSADKPINIIDFATDFDLIDLAYNACESLRQGYTVDELIDVIVTSLGSDIDPINYEAGGAILGAAVGAFCPMYQ